MIFTHDLSHPAECQMHAEEGDMTRHHVMLLGMVPPKLPVAFWVHSKGELPLLGIKEGQILSSLSLSARSFHVHPRGQSHPNGAALWLNHWFSLLEASKSGNRHAVLAGNTRGHKAEGEKRGRGLQR